MDTVPQLSGGVDYGNLFEDINASVGADLVCFSIVPYCVSFCLLIQPVCDLSLRSVALIPSLRTASLFVVNRNLHRLVLDLRLHNPPATAQDPLDIPGFGTCTVHDRKRRHCIHHVAYFWKVFEGGFHNIL